MKKRLSKILLAISLFFMMFFINNNKAYAENVLCDWSVPNSYTDNKGNVIYDTNTWYKISFHGYKEFSIYIDGIEILEGKGQINNNSSEKCPKYIIFFNSSKKVSPPSTSVTAKEFADYIVHQYDSIPENNIELVGNGYKKIYNDVFTIKNYGTHNGGLLLGDFVVMSGVNTTYSNKNLNVLLNAGFSEKQLKQVFGIDTAKVGYDRVFYDNSKAKWHRVITSDFNKIGNKEEFYKNGLGNMIDQFKNNNWTEENIIRMKMKLFKNWFLINSRYLLEEDFEYFKLAYEYAYMDAFPYSTLKSNLEAIDCAIEQSKTEEDLQCSRRIKLTEVNFTGIEDASDYKITCNDVPDIFHSAYVVMIIIAPILVIVLGTIDFGKAVIASDESKMQKFKSKFPRRIIALVLLIIIPIGIRFFISAIAGFDNTLLDCIILGNDNTESEVSEAVVTGLTFGNDMDSYIKDVVNEMLAERNKTSKTNEYTDEMLSIANSIARNEVNSNNVDSFIRRIDNLESKIENDSEIPDSLKKICYSKLENAKVSLKTKFDIENFVGKLSEQQNKNAKTNEYIDEMASIASLIRRGNINLDNVNSVINRLETLENNIKKDSSLSTNIKNYCVNRIENMINTLKKKYVTNKM